MKIINPTGYLKGCFICRSNVYIGIQGVTWELDDNSLSNEVAALRANLEFRSISTLYKEMEDLVESQELWTK